MAQYPVLLPPHLTVAAAAAPAASLRALLESAAVGIALLLPGLLWLFWLFQRPPPADRPADRTDDGPTRSG